MTVSKALINWLYGFGDIAIDEEISTEQLAAQAEAYGLYKDQQTSIHCYVDGTRDVTAYYLLLARQPAQAERQRQAEDGGEKSGFFGLYCHSNHL